MALQKAQYRCQACPEDDVRSLVLDHANIHTDYSFLDGACQVDRLVARAKKLGLTSLAITDRGNLLAAVLF